MPQIKISSLGKDAKLGLWKIEETEEELLSQLKMSAKDLETVQSMNHGKRYLHWLSSRVLLRKMLKTDKLIKMSADENGKPVLENFKYNISISHSGDMAAVLISPKGEVGVDLEKMEPRINRVAHKFMNREALDALNEKTEIQEMYVHWCAKEALYKLYSKKKLAFKENLPIEPFEFKGAGQIRGRIVQNGFDKQYKMKYEQINDEYMLVYVVDNPN